MKAIDGYFLIKPEDLHWRPSNMMKIPNADFLERTKSEILGARLWRLPPKSANTLHKHVRAEEFYFVVEGVGRIRVENAAALGIPHFVVGRGCCGWSSTQPRSNWPYPVFARSRKTMIEGLPTAV